MSRDWSWWDAWKSGDPDTSKAALERETDRSLAKDPGRWSWRSSDQIDTEERHRGKRGGHVEERQQRSGKGDVGPGESRERNEWRDREWREARDDYRRQNPNDDRDRRDDDRGLFW